MVIELQGKHTGIANSVSWQPNSVKVKNKHACPIPSTSHTVLSLHALCLQMYYWKRTMTGDFATILWRLKLLGFNAIRVPFRFEFLNNDLPPPNGGSKTEFFNCMVSMAEQPVCICANHTVRMLSFFVASWRLYLKCAQLRHPQMPS